MVGSCAGVEGMGGENSFAVGGFTLHDRCSRQLASGFRGLRFSGQLEAEYRAHMLAEQLSSAQVCLKVGLAIWLGFAGLDFYRLDLVRHAATLHPHFWLLLAIRWGMVGLFVFGLLYLERFKAHFSQIAFIIYTSLGVASALIGLINHAHDVPRAEATQIIVIMVAFMPIGLTFFQALAAAVLITAFSAIAGLLMLSSTLYPSHLHLSLMMALAIPVGATGGYLREHAHREQFLLRGMLERFAFYDPLTSLANRRLFEQHIATALSHAARQREPVVYATFDVDFFKQYNDLYGHAAGDKALRLVASVLAGCAHRPMDMAARLGGEEFALLLYGTDLATAEQIIAQLRERIAALAIAHERSPVSQYLTVSAGVTQHNGAEEVEQLFGRADRLLYRSKEAGRDRATFG